MRPESRLRLGCGIAAAACLLALAGLLRGAGFLLEFLPRVVVHYEQRAGRELQRAGLLAHWDLDAVRPRDLVGGGAVSTGGTRLVGGREGRARSFLPDEHGFLRTSVPLSALGDRFSFTCWLRFPDTIPNQQVFQYLAVREGKLVLQLPGQETLAWPIAVRGRFFHVAVTVDAGTGWVILYVDGEKKGQYALRALAHRGVPITFGQERWTPPPDFTLDEASVWSRALAPREIRRLSRLRWSLAADSGLAYVVKLKLARALWDSYRAVLQTADLFDPFLREDRVYSAGLSSYAIVLSRNDVRYFNGYANEQAENGLNAPGTSRKRTVEYAAGERRGTASMELIAGEGGGPEGSAKRAFSLETLADGGEPEKKVVFRPTEGLPYLLEVLVGRLARACGSSAVAPELCPVNINGTFEGLYVCTETPLDQRPGPLWDAGEWRTTLGGLPVFRDEVLKEFDGLASAWDGALRSDRKSPLTGREIRHDLRGQRRLLEDALADRGVRSDEALADRVAAYVRQALFLGDNPHATLVVGDLDLSVKKINGAELAFASLTPAVLAGDGRVSPPRGGAVPAVLRVSIRSGAAAREKDLAFTVLPVRRRIPILRIEAEGEPEREAAAACLAEFVDGEGRPGGALEGKIRLRGNTSLHRRRNEKKYYRLALARPADVPGVARTDLLYLTSGWRDVTMMRERLSYDLYRSFSEPGKPRFSPHVRFVELVVNGDYKGLYGLSDRVDAALLGFGKKGAAPRPVLYKAVGEQANFQTPAREAYIQKVPDWRDGEHWGPFEELIGFIGKSSPEQFRERVERVLDVDGVIDFEILLLLTNNLEGRNYNLFLARRGGPDARFFVVPWDYDMTFHSEAVPSNFLIGRLHRDLPGYGRRVHERWQALRRDRLSAPGLARRIDELEAELAEAIGRNYGRWPLPPGETWEANVKALREYIGARLLLLDGHFRRAAGA